MSERPIAHLDYAQPPARSARWRRIVLWTTGAILIGTTLLTATAVVRAHFARRAAIQERQRAQAAALASDRITSASILENERLSTLRRLGRQGATLVIDSNSREIARDATTVTIRAVLNNGGGSDLVVGKPTLHLHWGTLDTPIRERTMRSFELDSSWARLEPGTSREVELAITLPSVAGEYSVFASFSASDDEASKHPVDRTSTHYSNPLILQVR